jgi:uncharacterized flavoprotein (TIGR03862 family)
MVVEAMPSPARKFLMAGRGGLNLTHSEPLDRFLSRYAPADPLLLQAIRDFPPEDLRAFAAGLGQATFVGSSGRVFPVAMKASPLLRAWLSRLAGLGVGLETRRRWLGWTASGALAIERADGGVEAVTPKATILAMGGASWPRLGSDGRFALLLAAQGVVVTPLRPANGGLLIAWSPTVAERHQGQPLKRIALSLGEVGRRGEVVITRQGLEGGAAYALSGVVRDALARMGHAAVTLDLRPDESVEALAARLARRRPGASLSTHLRKALSLPPAAIAVLREAGPLPQEPEALAGRIKAIPLAVAGVAGLERAISTAGGVAFAAVDSAFMLRRLPGVFVAGEMLDWEAPTGGYLLQACFATGAAAGRGALAFVRSLDERLERIQG